MNFRNEAVMNGIKSLLVLLCVLVCSAVPGLAEESKGDPREDLVDRISIHYNKIGTFRAVYEQIAESQAMGGPQPIVFKDVTEGELLFMKPNLIRLDQKVPRNEVIVSDGKTSWWYIPDEKKAYKYAYVSQAGVLEALSEIFSGKRKLTESFRVIVLKSSEELVKLRLEPKFVATDFEYLDIGLNNESLELKDLQITNLLGQLTSFTFTGVEEDVDISPDLFSFTPPKGTEVIVNK